MRAYSCVCLILLSVLAGLPAHAQLYGEWFVKRWTVEEGLPQNSVLDLVQAPTGFIYLATEAGLACFDGLNFTLYNTDNVSLFKSNRIRRLIVTRDSSLWMFLVGGQLVRLKNQTFTSFDVSKNRMLAKNDYWLEEDHEGNIMYCTDGAVFAYLERKSAFRKVKVVKKPMHGIYKEIYASAVEGDRAGTVFCEAGGIYRWHNRKYEYDSALNNLFSTKNKKYLNLKKDLWDKYWLISADGLVTARGGKVISYPFPEDFQAQGAIFLVDRQENVWIASKTGVYVKRKMNSTFTAFATNTNSFSASLMEDFDGNIWLGTHADGLLQFSKNPFEYLPLQTSVTKNTLAVNISPTDSSLWISLGLSGMVQIKNNKIAKHWQLQDGKVNPTVWASLFTKDESLYLGSLYGGVFRIRGDTLTCLKQRQSTPINQVTALYEHPSLGILVGHEGGVAVVQNDSVVPGPWPIGYSAVTGFYQQPNGPLWITARKGLGWLLPTKKIAWLRQGGTHIPIPHRGIFLGRDNTLYFGTDGWGLGVYKAGKLAYISSKEGLPNNVISYVYEGPKKYLILSSNRGLIKLPKADVHAILNGKAKKVEYASFGASDGMLNSEFNGGFTPSGLVLSPHKIVLPSLYGPVVVDLDLIDKRVPTPTPVVLSIQYGGTKIENPTNYRTNYTDERMELSYTAPSFTQVRNLRFRYRLLGYDKDWVYAGTHRQAVYTKVPPGDYVFELSVQNQPHSWLPSGTKVAIEIVPPMYMTVWFKLLVLIFLVGIFLYTFYYREKRQLTISGNKSALMSVMPDLMLRLDNEGRYVEYLAGNPKDLIQPFAHMKGKLPEEVVPDLADMMRQNMQQARQTGRVQKHIYTLKIPNMPLQVYEWRLVSVRGGEEYLLIIRNITRQARTRAKFKRNRLALKNALIEKIALLEQLTQAENARLTVFMDAQESERHRIAQDLHDSVGQLISTVKLQVDNLKGAENTESNREQGLRKIQHLLDAVTQEIRSISFNLLPASLAHFGLTAALKDLVEGVPQSSNIKISFYENMESHNLSVKTQTYIYRIVQEALRNILQHACATEADIQIIEHEEFFLLEISDNGIGFDNEAGLAKAGSSGLKNMAARVKTLGGRLNVESGHKGTFIFIHIPKKLDQLADA